MSTKMIPALGTEGLKLLKDFLSQKTLLVFDYDGTLSPIVSAPHEARMHSDWVPLVRELMHRVPSAILTGRSRDDLISRLDFHTPLVVGNHGAEGLPGLEARSQKWRKMCESWYKQLEESNELRLSGLVIENKSYSISIHYRNTAHPEKVRSIIAEILQRLTPHPRIVSGKFVENITAHDAPDKGDAVIALMQYFQVKQALFVGDDVTDEDVFRLQNPGIMGIRVGWSGESHARFYLKEQEDVFELLRVMMDFLPQHHKTSDLD